VTPQIADGEFRYGYDELAQLVGITPPAGPGSAAQTFEYDFLFVSLELCDSETRGG
jgi:hypothetical protein